MKIIVGIIQTLLFLVVAHSGAQNTGAKVFLPIEVLGAEGITEERTLTLTAEQAAKVDRLWLQANNISYENKASVRINNGNWITFNHETVYIQSPEKERGGMSHGGHNTIRFSFPVSDFKSGENIIYFRFNFSDAISNGYRVVRMNLLDPVGTKLLDDSFFEEEDPFTWKSPYYDEVNQKEPDDLAAKIAQGKDYWYNAPLTTNYLQPGKKGFWYGYELGGPAPMRAKCASCHTQDGRDLEIFGYSNRSIIERAKFHKLTEEEGKLIATYIRSLSEEHDNVGRYGRPWNPPYQPGPEIANRPIEQWAAGAGLDAVLESDKDMLPYMFPNGVDQEKVYDRFDSDKMVDRSVIPLAIQFPDWKHWLPIIHPMDAYTKDNHWNDPFSNVAPIQGGKHYFHHPKKAYEDFRAYLEAMPPKNRNKNDLMSENRTFWFHYRGFLEAGHTGDKNHWRTPSGTATKKLGDGVSREMAATSLARLMAVQFFEIMNEFDLQDKAHWFAPPEDQPGERQWFGYIYQVFEVPAHFQASVSEKELPKNDGYDIVGDGLNFYGQSQAAGVYESTNWYHLQLVVNGGNGMVSDVSPVDYNYVPDFIVKAASTSGVYEPLRYYHNTNAMYQTRSWSGGESPNSGKGFKIRVQGPWHLIGRSDRHDLNDFAPTVWPTFLDDVKPGMSKWVLNAQLRQFLKEVRRPYNRLSNWNRSTNGSSLNLDSKNKKTSDLRNVGQLEGSLDYWADKMYQLFPEFQRLGVDCQILEEMLDWSEEAWPNINWDTFRKKGELQLNLLSNDAEDCGAIGGTITAQAFNEGDNPNYEWWVNNAKVNNTTSELDVSKLRPGSAIKCRVTSSINCISNGWVEREMTLPDDGFIVKVRKNQGAWETLDNTIACIDDTMEFKVDLDLKAPLFWLDAMDVGNNGTAPAEGTKIATWVNKAGNNYSMRTQSNNQLQPTYSKTGMNGLPALMFGMNDADGLELIPTNHSSKLNGDWTILVAAKYYKESNGGDWNAVLGNENGDSGFGFYFERKYGRTRFKVNGNQKHARHYEDGTDFILMISKEGKKIKTYINGKLETEINASSTNLSSSRAFYLGQRDGGNAGASWFHKGPVSEVLFYEQAISESQKEYLEGYLAHKWKFNQSLLLDHLYRERSPLYVNLETPDGRNVVFEDANNSEAFSLNSNEKFGDFVFTSPRSSCTASNVVVSVTNSSTLDDGIVRYSLNEGKYMVGTDIDMRELDAIELSPNFELNGDFQWESPEGNLITINENPEKFRVTYADDQSVWKLHIKQDPTSCIATDQTYAVTLNVNEIPESEKDDDLDGVTNDKDQCPNSVAGAVVNSVGCFDLPANNFIVYTKGETCLNTNNGSIDINAGAEFNYTATLNNSETYQFTSEEFTIDNLNPGTYELCITVDGVTNYEQCFDLTVDAAAEIAGKTEQVKYGDRIIENIRITAGTAPYTVTVNGEERITTVSKEIAIDVHHGDKVKVSSKLVCEGTIDTDVNLIDYFAVYPNPTRGMANIVIPNADIEEVSAAVYNAMQQKVAEAVYEVVDGKIQVSLENLPSGMYFIKLNLETPVNLRIVKQ